MAITYIPVIRLQEYEAFKSEILGEFPATHELYMWEVDKWIAAAPGGGPEVVRVDVAVDAFREWLANGGDRTLNGLKNCAFDLGSRR